MTYAEYHTPWSWAWRLVRNKVRWMARVLIVFGAAVYAVLRAVLAGYRWFVALGLPGIVSASLVLAILLFCDWLLPKVASQVLTQEEVDRVEQESAQ